MLICKNLSDLPVFDQPTALTIGCFDGLHRGHQHLISHMKKKTLLSTLATFTSPLLEKSPLSIISLEEKLRFFEMLGIDILLLLSFDEISTLSYDDFLDQIGAHFLSTHLVLGKGSLFGKNREGDKEKVLSYAAKNRMQAEYLSQIREEGEIISSSWIRQAILQGDLALLQRLLGRPFSYTFFPPFSRKFFSSPYSSELSLELPLQSLTPLPMGSYEVHCEMQTKSFSSIATLANNHLRLILPASQFTEGAPLSIIFYAKRKPTSFFSQNKISKDLYV
jgi:riboflavin kinase/FMN adenylyltransferase